MLCWWPGSTAGLQSRSQLARWQHSRLVLPCLDLSVTPGPRCRVPVVLCHDRTSGEAGLAA